MDSKDSSNRSPHSNTEDTWFQTDDILGEEIWFDTGVGGGGIEIVPSTISNLLDTWVKIALLVSGDTGSVLAVLHVDTQINNEGGWDQSVVGAVHVDWAGWDKGQHKPSTGNGEHEDCSNSQQ